MAKLSNRASFRQGAPARFFAREGPCYENEMLAALGQGHDGEEVLFEGRAALVPSASALLLSIITLGLWLLVRWYRAASRSYRITTRRIVVESGVLSKKLEQIDLYRVADYTVERPFSQRLLGTGNLLLKTFDKTTPELDVREIRADVVALYEQVRAATEADKLRRGVRLVDYETGGPQP